MSKSSFLTFVSCAKEQILKAAKDQGLISRLPSALTRTPLRLSYQYKEVHTTKTTCADESVTDGLLDGSQKDSAKTTHRPNSTGCYQENTMARPSHVKVEKSEIDPKTYFLKAWRNHGPVADDVKLEHQRKDQRDPNDRIAESVPEVEEARDRRLNVPLTRYGRIGKNAFYYTRKMSILAREKRVKEALAMFEETMMVRDRVLPNKRTFVVLIGILGRAGYTDKAFEMFRKMNKLGLDPEDHIYTSLFNACANCPFPAQGLEKAETLLKHMKDKGIPLNIYSVKAAAKAMAFCGNFPKAFTIMDEASTFLRLDVQCFDHLLMACASDRQSGFRRALEVWQKMGEFNVRPEINTYNLLVRCIRDCSIGDPREFVGVFGLGPGEDAQSELKLLGGDGLLWSDRTKANDRGTVLTVRKETGTNKESIIEFTQKSKRTSKARDAKDLNAVNGGKNENHSASGDVFDAELQSFLPFDADLEALFMQDHADGHADLHNLFHDVPQFDKNVADFLSERDASRDLDGEKIYEWWEEQPIAMEPPKIDVRGENLQDVFVDLCPEPAFSFASEENHFSGDETGLHPIYNIILTHSPKSHQRVEKANIKELTTTKISSLKDLEKPEYRLAMLGGADKLVAHMLRTGSNPDIRTFSQMVSCLPSNELSEYNFLLLMEECQVRPDVDLLNDIMMMRNMRRDPSGAKAVLLVMSSLGLVPNMRTYAALALTCNAERDAKRLLKDMEAANLEPTSEVLGHLVYISLGNFTYKLHMLRLMERMSLRPTEATIRAIEKSVAITKKSIITAEKNRTYDHWYLSPEFQASFQNFLRFYRRWLQRTPIGGTKHPWQAFQTNKPKRSEKEENEKVGTAV